LWCDLQLQISWGDDCDKTDLDCSAIAFDNNKVMVDVCFFNKTSACNKVLLHSGDKRDGLSPGVDEEITLDLRKEVLGSIAGFIFVINGCNTELSKVKNGVITCKGSSGQTLGETPIPAFESHGVVSLILYRTNDSGQWLLNFVNTISKGKNFQESMPQIQKTLTRTLEGRFQGLQGNGPRSPLDRIIQ
jgi:stress response protein SCP2